MSGAAIRTLIVAHENTDFDGLAAMVAAQRLYPGAVLGLARRLARPVRAYWALHKDLFEARRIDHVDLDALERLVVVDVRDRSRLSALEPALARRDAGGALELHVFDHHPPGACDLIGDVHEVAPLGAVTTLFIERLRDAEMPISAAEATLFALGIHEDTASLTLAHTTVRDARALAWVLSQGAGHGPIERYLHVPLTADQRAALTALLGPVRETSVAEVRVATATLLRERSVDGLGRVVSLARQLAGFDTLVVASRVARPASVQVVARSRARALDVGAAARAMGGGGHRGAASVHLKGEQDPDAALERFLDALRAIPPAPTTVAELMSRPVWAVEPRCSLREVEVLLEVRGVHGVPVVRDGRVTGIVSSEDVARARAADRLDLPAGSHMSGKVVSVEAEESVEVALERMVEHDVGRLPVIDAAGELLGIVSRSDVRAALYPGRGEPSP